MIFRTFLNYLDIRYCLSCIFDHIVIKLKLHHDDQLRFYKLIYDTIIGLFINYFYKPIMITIMIFKEFIKLIFFRIPIVIIYTLILESFNLTYFFLEFIYSFISAYQIYFKFPRRIIFTYINYQLKLNFLSDKINDDEFFKQTTLSPDLLIHYPMRFALNSVLIRLTGVILCILLFIILFLNSTHLFFTTDEIFFGKHPYVKMTIYAERFNGICDYNSETFWTSFKCMTRFSYFTIYSMYKYLYYETCWKNGLDHPYWRKSYFQLFPSVFFCKLLILIIPLHLYVVYCHAYKNYHLVSLFFNNFFFFSKRLIKVLLEKLIIIFKKLWDVIYLILFKKLD